MDVTDLERKLIENIGDNSFNNGDPTEGTWSDCLDDGPNRIDVNSIPGICGSLVKKGLALSDGSGRDSVVCLTDEGLVIFYEIKGDPNWTR